jgi:hypothetical protein
MNLNMVNTGPFAQPWMQQNPLLNRAGFQMPAPAPKPSEAALPVYSRPAPTMSTMPQAGWQGPQGGQSLADIIDGPQIAPAPSITPSMKPQQNFDAMGQQMMAQILGGQ